ncbi:MAG: hypothetical protein KDA78_17630, partial [Planctomycetaceae bacterium]|nr:hypothetical protein [Planctomycetaceae bacterium]
MQPPTSEQHLVTRWRSRCVVFILLLMSGLNGGAHAQAEMEVQVGVSGTYKIGCWTSAEIHASIAPETSCRALVKVLDADG